MSVSMSNWIRASSDASTDAGILHAWWSTSAISWHKVPAHDISIGISCYGCIIAVNIRSLNKSRGEYPNEIFKFSIFLMISWSSSLFFLVRNNSSCLDFDPLPRLFHFFSSTDDNPTEGFSSISSLPECLSLAVHILNNMQNSQSSIIIKLNNIVVSYFLRRCRKYKFEYGRHRESRRSQD